MQAARIVNVNEPLEIAQFDRVVLVGLFGGELKLNLVTMPTRAYRLIGSYTGTLSDVVELVSLATRGVINPIVSNTFKLSQATEALSKLKDGKIIGRRVINPCRYHIFKKRKPDKI